MPTSSSTRLADASVIPADQLRDGGDVLGDRPVRQQPDALDHVADPPPQLDGILLHDVLAGYLNRARSRLDQTIDHLHRGRLPTTRRAHEHDRLAFVDVERQIVDRVLPEPPNCLETCCSEIMGDGMRERLRQVG